MLYTVDASHRRAYRTQQYYGILEATMRSCSFLAVASALMLSCVSATSYYAPTTKRPCEQCPIGLEVTLRTNTDDALNFPAWLDGETCFRQDDDWVLAIHSMPLTFGNGEGVPRSSAAMKQRLAVCLEEHGYEAPMASTIAKHRSAMLDSYWDTKTSTAYWLMCAQPPERDSDAWNALLRIAQDE
ncbi:MAG: hypothetical protein ABIG71_02950 [Candidatus Uhrbacteria bacterium]